MFAARIVSREISCEDKEEYLLPIAMSGKGGPMRAVDVVTVDLAFRVLRHLAFGVSVTWADPPSLDLIASCFQESLLEYCSQSV